MDQNNFYILVGLAAVTFVLWSIFYGIPSLLFSLLYSLLGNLFLFLLLLLVAIYNPLYALIGLLVVFLLIRVVHVKEGFGWTDSSINHFIQVQDTLNQNRFYDIGKIQEHTTQEEVDYFLKYNIWPWSTQTIQMYKDAIDRNPIVQNYSKDAIMEARKVYPEFSILEILALQAREGDFLTNGIVINDTSNFDRDGRGTYAYRMNMIPLQNRKNAKQIRCSVDTGRPILINDKGDVSDLTDDQLPNLIPGFQYLHGTCNVCSNMSGNPNTNYRCGFTFFDKPSSPIWNWFWSSTQ
jgi:hypothetical protein